MAPCTPSGAYQKRRRRRNCSIFHPVAYGNSYRIFDDDFCYKFTLALDSERILEVFREDTGTECTLMAPCGSQRSVVQFFVPLPSNRHHWSSGDCREGKGENYQVCSVQYCVQQLCTVQCTHIWTDLTGLWIGFCLTGPISLCLDSFLCMYVNVFSVWLYIAWMCSIVTWWGGPGGIEAYP